MYFPKEDLDYICEKHMPKGTINRFNQDIDFLLVKKLLK